VEMADGGEADDCADSGEFLITRGHHNRGSHDSCDSLPEY